MSSFHDIVFLFKFIFLDSSADEGDIPVCRMTQRRISPGITESPLALSVLSVFLEVTTNTYPFNFVVIEARKLILLK